MKSFLDEENNLLKNMVDKVVSTGANVVICQKGIDDIAQHYLAKANILAVRRAKESDMAKLACPSKPSFDTRTFIGLLTRSLFADKFQ